MRHLARRSILVVAVLLSLTAPLSRAAPSPPTEDAVVEELVVTAADPNPAWWQIRKGDSTVWLLGGPMGPMPKDVRWDDGPLKTRMAGAKSLILPSAASVGIGDIFGLLRLRGELKEKQPLEPSLPPPLAKRFAAARESLGKDAGRYDGWSPVWAGRLLQQDYFNQWKLLGGASPTAVARNVARHASVQVARVVHKGMPVLRSAVQQMREDEKAQACLAGYLEAVEVRPERYRAAAKAWARGDIRKAIDLPRGSDVCRELFLDEFASASVSEQVEAISAALETPGTTVAIAPLRQLLIRNGVLQQLKARGFQITDPSTLAD
ncbi:MAG: TraB/GumN family protein [Phenylobacterium sp.]